MQPVPVLMYAGYCAGSVCRLLTLLLGAVVLHEIGRALATHDALSRDRVALAAHTLSTASGYCWCTVVAVMLGSSGERADQRVQLFAGSVALHCSIGRRVQ